MKLWITGGLCMSNQEVAVKRKKLSEMFDVDYQVKFFSDKDLICFYEDGDEPF